ncbi:hypothetical protein [Paraliomyxa miuraensis]|uniref:hypothetical protein n=1 Tax=Paraliomyxa miuraensis TaxID=376150 RepID=UPI00224EED8D|nr:hypothetical protein [Paraliomyxa miuraensis]MCX4243413.1 hypothetical protein [Paraliomyxa miuraensis]
MGQLPSVADLVHQLRAFHGYRTLWWRPDGMLLHAEPEEELEDIGYRYVATLMRPGPEALAEALLRAGIVLGAAEPDEPTGTTWVAAAEPGLVA